MRYKIMLMMTVVFISTQCHAGTLTSTISDQDAVEVTVYNSNLGLVKDTRHFKVNSGVNELRFMDVASSIMPQTVQIKPLDNVDAFSVLEQNYEYDLMDSNKLMDKYVGKSIRLMTKNPYQDKTDIVEATLLSNNNGPIYKIGDEIYLNYGGSPILPKIPENLVSKPTLTWLYKSKTDAKQNVQVSYLTNGIGWKADYILVTNKEDNGADLSGWVTLDNNSGAEYKNAKLKLVAGNVNRVQDMRANVGYLKAARAMAMESDAAGGFQEQSFFEYHIYDLQRKTTIKNNQSKQVSLLEASKIKVEKEFMVQADQNYFWGNYGGQELKQPVNVYLKFKNSKENHMGMPLPAGTMRLYKEDGQKSLQFIGEDAIKHTPKDEDVEIKVGEAFDVVAKRVQMNFVQRSNYFEMTWELTVRNHKEEDITVGFKEPLYGDWKITSSSHSYKKLDANSARFDVAVPKDGEVKVSYTVNIRRN